MRGYRPSGRGAAPGREPLSSSNECWPGITSLEICRRVRARENTCMLPLIMVTAATEPSGRVPSIGADDYAWPRFATVCRGCDERVLWAESTPSGAARGTAGKRAKAAIPTRAQRVDFTVRSVPARRSVSELCRNHLRHLRRRRKVLERGRWDTGIDTGGKAIPGIGGVAPG